MFKEPLPCEISRMEEPPIIHIPLPLRPDHFRILAHDLVLPPRLLKQPGQHEIRLGLEVIKGRVRGLARRRTVQRGRGSKVLL